MKETICTLTGVAAAAAASLFGSRSSALATLLIFMAADYITGLIVAGVFHNSGKTTNGALDSSVGLRGLCKKGVILLFVLIAHRLDVVIGTQYIREGVIVGFMTNELISLTENTGLMGVPLPDAVKKAVEILQKSEGEEEE